MTEQKEITIISDDAYEPINAIGVRLKKGKKLFDYQTKVVSWMKKRCDNPVKGVEGGIVSLTMGLGKTLISLCWMMSFYEPPYPFLVICPKSVLYTWKKDIATFFGDQCPFHVLHAEEPDCDDLTFEDIRTKKIVLTTYESLTGVSERKRVFEDLKIFNDFHKVIAYASADKPSQNQTKRSVGFDLILDVPWQGIVCDESHRFSNPKTKLFRGIMSLYGGYKFCLSGTPIVNYNSDLYSQFRFLGYHDHVMKNFTPSFFYNSGLQKCMINMNYEDCGITLPTMHYKVEYLSFSTKEEETLYAYYREKTKDVLSDWSKGKQMFSAVLEMLLRQRQICCAGRLIIPDERRKKPVEPVVDGYGVSKDVLSVLKEEDPVIADWLAKEGGSSGLEATKIVKTLEIIQKVQKGEKVIVFAMFNKVFQLLETQLKRLGVKSMILNGTVTGKKREALLNEFETDSSVQVMLANYKVTSEGLNLTVANHIILMEGWWNLATLQQASSRCHRMGQSKDVYVWRLFIKNTVEERMEDICKRKMEMIGQFMSSEPPKRTGGGLNAHVVRYLLE